MAETLVALNQSDYPSYPPANRSVDDCVDHLMEYPGDYAVDPHEHRPMVRRNVGSCTISRVQVDRPIKLQRSWHNIRGDATDTVALWVVKRGDLLIAHAGKSREVKAGSFAIAQSLVPHSVQCGVGVDLAHESYYLLIPSHIFRKFIAREVVNGFSVRASCRLFNIIEYVLAEVFTPAEGFTDKTERLMLGAILSALSDTVQDHKGFTPAKESLPEQRIKMAMRYIDTHLSDPELSSTRVAKASGITSRYLSSLLKQKGLSFADYVRQKRLKIARRWLSSSKPGELSIAEIAFRVGFKSPAHFSRIFKQAFDKGPREYRAECIASQLNGANDISAAKTIHVS